LLSKIVSRLIAASLRAPWLVVVAAVLLTAAAGGYATRHFDMTTDTAQLIAPTVAWRVDEAAVDAAFPQNRDLAVIVVDGATPEAAELGARALAAGLAADTAHFRRVSRPDATDFFATNGLLFGTATEVGDTTARLIAAQPFLGPLAADPSLRGVMTSLSNALTGVETGAATLADLQAPLTAIDAALTGVLDGQPRPFSWTRLLGAGRGQLGAPTRRIILAQPVLDFGALMAGEAAHRAVRDAARALPDVRVRLTGAVPLADEEFASLSDRAALVGGTMAAAMLLVLWLATRSLRTVAAITVTTLAGLVITAALGLALVGRFNLISVAFIPLFVGLGIDFGIQFSIRVRAELATGTNIRAALTLAGQRLGGSLVVAAAAVALGFAAFLPTDYVGISELGVIASAGMIVALLLSLTLLPALLLLLRPAAAGDTGLTTLAAAETWLARRRRAVLWAFGIAMAASVALLPFVRFDFNPYDLRDPSGEAMATLADLMRDPDRSPNTVDVLAPDAATASRLIARLAALPEVSQVIGLTSFVPDGQPAKLAAISDARDLLDLTLDPIQPLPPPTDAELVAALRETAAKLRSAAPNAPLAATLERLASGTPQQRAAANALLAAPLGVMLDQARTSLGAQPVTLATLPATLVRDWRTPDGRYRLQVFPRGDSADNATLKRFTAAVRAVAPHAAGPPVSAQEAAHTVARAFTLAGLYALIAISALLLLVLRSAREVAFTLAPVVLSGFLTLATCVVIGQPLNFANIIAFPLLFGVGTAFHIYFVVAWRDGAGRLLTSSLARGVLFSALATGAAFGALCLSSHPGTASMGLILMIALGWTLVCALIFEPALLGPSAPASPRRAR